MPKMRAVQVPNAHGEFQIVEREIPQRIGSSAGEGGGASPWHVDERDRVPRRIAQAASSGRQRRNRKDRRSTLDSAGAVSRTLRVC